MRRGGWVLLVGAVLLLAGCTAESGEGEPGAVMVEIRAGEYPGGQEAFAVQIQDADGGLSEETLRPGETVALDDIPSGEVVITIEGQCELMTEVAPGEQLHAIFEPPGHCTI